MKHKLLISAAALCLAWPPAGWADQQPPPGAGPGDQQIPGEKRPPRVTHAPAPTGQAPAPRPPGFQPPPRPQPGGVGPTIRRPPPPQTAPTHRPTGPTPRPSPPVQIERGIRPGHLPPAQRSPPPNLPKLGDWSRDRRGPDRDRAGQQWRQDHRGWDNAAPWRRNSDWWRGNSAFRLFLGPRIGYFFVPAYGYVRVPSDYDHRYWIPGQYLPNWFWRYTVADYWTYGLPAPPPGCAWVWVDNDVALIDTSDGYILDIVHNVW